MGFLTGLVRGVSGGLDETRKANEDKAAKQHDLEMRIYEHLVNADDPEIRDLALTGVLSGAQPQKKNGGLGGWLGEVQSSPILEQITRLRGTPVTKQRQVPSLNTQPMSGSPGATVPPPSDPNFVGPREMPPPAAVPPPSGPAVDWRTESYQAPREVFRSRETIDAEKRAAALDDYESREAIQARYREPRESRVTNPKDDYRRPIYDRAAKGDPDAIRQVEIWDNTQPSPEDTWRRADAERTHAAADATRQDAAADRRAAADETRRNMAERWKEGELAKLEAQLEKEYPELVGVPPDRLARHEQAKQRVQDSYLVQIGAGRGRAAEPPPGAPRATATDTGGRSGGPGRGGKTVTLAQVQAVAQKNGTTVQQERQRAKAEEFIVR